ncbi:MAG: hypothetical protein ACO1OB_24300 [Archangium sp.]
MRVFVSLLCVALTGGCKKEPPGPKAPAISPAEVKLEGTYHAVQCGPVTAVWSGDPDMLAQQAPNAPKSFGVESLAFRFFDGSTEGFAPTGQLFFSDWTFDIFSPDCSLVALQVDHFGPFHVVPVDQLRGYLDGHLKPVVVQALSEKESLVHGQLRWINSKEFEFVASCCGGAQAFRANTKDGSLERLLDAPKAPKGLRRGANGWEVVP